MSDDRAELDHAAIAEAIPRLREGRVADGIASEHVRSEGVGRRFVGLLEARLAPVLD